MWNFNQLKIGQRMALGYGFVILLLCAIALIAMTRIHAINESTDSMFKDRYAKIVLANQLNDGVGTQARALRNAIIGASDPAVVKGALDDVATAVEKNGVVMDKLKAMLNTPKGLELFQVIADTRTRYAQARAQNIALLRDGKVEAAGQHLLNTLRGPQNEFFAAVTAMVNFQHELMEKEAAKAAEFGRSAVLITLTLSGLAVLAALVLGTLVTRSITAPIRQAVAVAEAVASGDLSSRIPTGNQDETGQLLDALRRMNASLVGIVGEVRNGSDSIATGSAQIATGNADLSQRTEEQASNLQQTAAAMEQLTGTVKNNAETARQANDLAASAATAASNGGAMVGQVVATMQAIADSSKRIADIIGTIDGIAFQTNILALNAAVEAARAGEQGRGFAVVASEVRNLAQRSAEAAKEIKALIGASVDKVDAGSRQVRDAGHGMADIVAQVKRVSDLIGEISHATQEQTTGIGQIGDAVQQLDQVTQQNAALVEESAAAAESLKQQAKRLVDAVSIFKLAKV